MKTIPVAYVDSKERFVEQIAATLRQEGVYRDDLLFRTIESRYLDRVREHGTDRAGFGNPNGWSLRHRYEDVIFASTEADLREAAEGDYGLSAFCRFDSADDPQITVYDGSQLDIIPDRTDEYVFKNPERKVEAVVCIIEIDDQLAADDRTVRSGE